MSAKQSIISTLIYHGIFDYPLTEHELYKYLIGHKSTKQSILKLLEQLIKNKEIFKSNGFIYLKNKSSTVKIRTLRNKYSQKKYKKAQFYSNLLKFVPTIKMVGVSGSLAMNNSSRGDDIDLVVITAKKSLWVSRAFANLILLPFKRDRNGQHIKDRACLNLFLDETDLKIKSQNLFTAHEICQLKPIWQRNNTYIKFLRANIWTKIFLPNWEAESLKNILKLKELEIILKILEIPAKKLQLVYMKSKITNEQISNTQIFLHPINHHLQIQKKYELGIKNKLT